MNQPDFTIRQYPPGHSRHPRWYTPSPETCPDGHRWVIGQDPYTLHTVPCYHPEGTSGHVQWECQTCGASWWMPPLEDGCTAKPVTRSVS